MPFINPNDPTKEIYEYDNGVKLIRKDPSVIWRRIYAACAKPGADGSAGESFDSLYRRWAQCSISENDTPEGKIAKYQDWQIVRCSLATATCDAFDLKPLDDDGNGVTENFAIAILREFMGEREKKEPSTEISPSESPPTVSVPATISSASGSVGARGRRRTTMGSRSTPGSPTPQQ